MHSCATEATTVIDEGAVRCMLEELRKLTFPPPGPEELALCGLIALHYPVVFTD